MTQLLGGGSFSGAARRSTRPLASGSPGLHRVVVAVKPYVVIAGQSSRGPPPDVRCDGRQCQHRRLIGFNPIRRAAPQHPVMAPSVQVDGPATAQPRLRRPTPTPEEPHPTPKNVATTRHTDLQRYGSGSTLRRPTANTRTPSSTPAGPLALRTWPYPTGIVTSGNQKSHCAISPA